MQAFHNDAKIKEKYLARVKAHIDADELARGVAGQCGKGCSIWCTFEYYDHRRAAAETDVSEWLWRLNDSFFEGISLEKSKTWPLEFLSAIKVGSDLEKIKGPFLIYLLEEVKQNVNSTKFPNVAAAIDGSIALWSRNDIGSIIWDRDAEAAALAARAAVWSLSVTRVAASAAAVAWAASAAAREASAAAWAARAAREAREAREARAYDQYADKLLALMKAV